MLNIHKDYSLLGHNTFGIDARTAAFVEYSSEVELLEAEGLRDKVILACGGPRITHELAKELGYDAGFGMNTYADDVASFIAEEYVRRHNGK